jgi:elongation factor P
MKIDTSDVKKGIVLQIENKLYKVIDMSHTHTGRGGATYNFKVKDIVNGGNQQFTYKSGTALEKVEVQTKNAIYLYNGGDTYSFMEQDSSEIYDLPSDKIEDVIPYLKENLDCFVMIFDGNVIGVILPNVIEYTIAETVPGVK